MPKVQHQINNIKLCLGNLLSVRIKVQVNTLAKDTAICFFYCRDYSFEIDGAEIATTKPQWHHYFLCGLRGINEHCNLAPVRKGMKALVDGTIPPCAGLSSSSALVCCAGLAMMRNYDQQLTKVRGAYRGLIQERE